MDDINFYCMQSTLTDPGQYAYLFDDLPENIPDLCEVLRNLFMHYADVELHSFPATPIRYAEMDNRSVTNILACILKYDSRSLTKRRETHHRVMGVCRDISLLLCAVLRHRKIPARLTSGFVNYYIPQFNLDAVNLEYWNEEAGRWCMVDSRTDPHSKTLTKSPIDFALYDVPKDKFLPAEMAWQHYREGKINGNHFGSRKYRGAWYVRNRLIHQLAFLNKKEMLIWDLWGDMQVHREGKPCLLEEQLDGLDKLAELIRNHKNNLMLMKDCYEKNINFKIRNSVSVFNPYLDQRVEYVNA